MGGMQELVRAQIMMFLYLCVGFLCRKQGYTDENVENRLSAAVTNIVLPCMIFDAILSTLKDVIFSEVLLVVAICTSIVLFSYGLGWLCYRKAPNGKRSVLIFGVMTSNSAFVGLPLIAAVYGDHGIFYAAIYMTVARVFSWTLGLNLFIQDGKGHALRRIVTNPNNLAVVFAVVIHVLGVQFTGSIADVVEEIGGTSTLLCMVMVGSLIASNLHWKKLLSPVAYGYSVIRLAVIPLVTMIVLQLMNIPPVIAGSVVFLVSSPAPTIACVMATRYGADKELAALLVLVSTMLSLVTQPIITYLCGL